MHDSYSFFVYVYIKFIIEENDIFIISNASTNIWR